MLETYLRTVDAAWPDALARIADRIHPVDRNATRIWFSLYPLLLEELRPRPLHFQLRGDYQLADFIHTSHRFLYGHRYWTEVREAALQAAPQATLDETILAAAPHDLAIGITAIALMSLRQAPAAFRQPPPPPEFVQESPGDWLARRNKKGWFAKPRIVFDEQDPAGSFTLRPTQDITMAAEQDKRPHHLRDARCFEDMGPIPVECRSGSCGTCWIGVLGGNENLSAVTPYERKRMEYLGYWDSGFEDPAADRPLIRLACQTQASGSASIVIPPWCGVFGLVRRARDNNT